MRYLSAKQILLIHAMLIEAYGGSHGVRDTGLLASLDRSPSQVAFGEELYPTIFEKAAVYAREIITTHPFLDGNKRTGITAAALYLERNGYTFVAQENELQNYAVSIATTTPPLRDIAAWLKKHSKKTLKRKVHN